MPTNLYGPGDNFDLENSHVLPAMIRKFHDAKADSAPVARLWGTGTPRREFLYVDDMADACLFLMERHDGSRIVNIGMGTDLTVEDWPGPSGGSSDMGEVSSGIHPSPTERRGNC
jgi:GDP-L-fucose synthase